MSSLSDVSLAASAGPKPAVVGAPSDLEWASFPSSASAGAPAAPAAPAEAAPAPSSSATAALIVPDAIASPTACLSLGFYRHMFDVGSGDVRDRLAAALWPLSRGTFLAVCRNKPDFWGPTWICATLIFAIGAGANLSSWLNFAPGSGAALSIWKYDFRLVTMAAATVYPFAFVLPTALWLVLNHLGVTGLPLVHLICIYGYSLTVFVPSAVSEARGGGGPALAAARFSLARPRLPSLSAPPPFPQLLCVLPNAGLQWTVTMFASALSALFVFKSTYPVVLESGVFLAMRAIVPLVILLQLGFGIVLKLFFFNF